MTSSIRTLPRRPRAALAVLLARASSRSSRVAGLGDGTAIGGRVASKVMPGLVPFLTTGMEVVIVTATNGKSTAATMIAAALGTDQTPAFNGGGSNMGEGVAMALSERPSAARAVLEVDEMVLGPVMRDTGARWVVLMNASREYTRGVSLERTLHHWADALGTAHPDVRLIANCDDPLIVHAAQPLDRVGRVVWVAGGLAWREDAQLCRRCGSPVRWPDDESTEWSCAGCDLARPRPLWSVHGERLRGPGNAVVSVRVRMPGRWLTSNAAFAVATAVAMGIPPEQAARAVTQVSDVDGRYRVADVEGRLTRLFLVKNPASWAEAVTLGSRTDTPVVFAMEAFSMRDMTPGWDVSLTGLREATVVVTGQRRFDVAVMLEVAGVPYTIVEDPLDAIRSVPRGPVHVIANYTAFKDLRRRLTP